MKTLFMIAAMLLLSFPDGAWAKPLSLDQINESVCKVSRTGAVGSGSVVAEDESHYYIMTNAHVVGEDDTVSIRLYVNGVQSPSFSAQVTWRVYKPGSSVDIAVAKMNKSSLGQWPAPRVIELAHKGFKVKAGDVIRAVGCPHGGWPAGWTGTVLSHDGGSVSFNPAPASGQSGSCVTVEVADFTGELHTRVGVLLAWNVGGDNGQSYGAGVSLEQIYSALNDEVIYHSIPQNYTPAIHKHEHAEHVEGKHNRRCNLCGLLKSHHTYASDHKYHCPDHVLPNHLTKLNNPTCPNGNCPINPFKILRPLIPKKPSTPSIGGVKGSPPPIKGSVPNPTPPVVNHELEQLKKELDKAQRIYVELDSLHKDLLVENDKTKEGLERLLGVENQLNLSLDNYRKLNGLVAGKTGEIKVLESELIEAASNNKTLVDNYKNLEEVRSLQVNTHKEEVAEQKWWTNLWGSATGGLGALGLLGLGWSGYKKYKAKGLKGLAGDAKTRLIDEAKKRFDDRMGVSPPPGSPPLTQPGPAPIYPGLLPKNPPTEEDCNPYINHLQEQLSECNQSNIDLAKTLDSYRHGDWREPPQVLYPKVPYGVGYQETAAPPVGLGPIPPVMPVHRYTAQEILDAVSKVGNTHREDPVLSQVPELVRQILETPRRPRNY